MKVKIIMGTGEKELEKKVNDFISQTNVTIIDLKLTGAGFAVWPVCYVMITYNEKD